MKTAIVVNPIVMNCSFLFAWSVANILPNENPISIIPSHGMGGYATIKSLSVVNGNTLNVKNGFNIDLTVSPNSAIYIPYKPYPIRMIEPRAPKAIDDKFKSRPSSMNPKPILATTLKRIV